MAGMGVLWCDPRPKSRRRTDRKKLKSVPEEVSLMEWLLALFARLALLGVWLWTPLVGRAFHGGWLLPLLGILFLPLTTLVYVLVFALSGDVTGWNWLWVVLAFLLDLAAHSYPARRATQARNRRTDIPSQTV